MPLLIDASASKGAYHQACGPGLILGIQLGERADSKSVGSKSWFSKSVGSLKVGPLKVCCDMCAHEHETPTHAHK